MSRATVVGGAGAGKSTLRIERLGHAGDGIAEGPVYVPRTLPGERVEGEVASNRMESPRILEPSPDRVSAPCPHYRSCGGCALQHAADQFVASWKADVVRRALSAHGIEAQIGPVVTRLPGPAAGPRWPGGAPGAARSSASTAGPRAH